jgi:hypothetical protein
MTLRLTRPRKRRNVTETRLRLGSAVLKTASEDAKHGAFWTWLDTGNLAAASVCHRLERRGLLQSADALFPDLGGQTYRLNHATEREATTPDEKSSACRDQDRDADPSRDAVP